MFTFLARSQAYSRWASQSSKVVTLPVCGFHGYVSRQSQGLTPQLRDITVVFLLITEKTSSFHHLFHSWVCYSHLCTSCVKGFVLYKYHYPPITLRGQTDTADSWDCCLYSPSFTVNNPSQVSPLALV